MAKKVSTSPVEVYLDAIAALTQRGDAREESYYPILKVLLEKLAEELNQPLQVTILPKKTEAGSPDFRIWDGAYRVIGYIEAKAPGTNLDVVARSEQLQRYRATFPNLLLTDFYEFRLYRQGECLKQVQIGRWQIARRAGARPPTENIDPFRQLIAHFFGFTLPPLLTAEELARQLARRTRFLRDEVILPEIAQKQKALWGFYEAFQKYLVADLKEADFADLYAQTLTYGLFAARMRAQGDHFNRRLAHDLIPPTIGILRDIFRYISLGDPSPQMETLIDDIAAVLRAADVQAILQAYQAQGKGDDPILHFYETFLAEYDPGTRERRGVYYTPQAVVQYIVRGVHALLRARFGYTYGLADEGVTLLDPAAGTCTFLAEAIRVAFTEYTRLLGQGLKDTLLRRHILPHFFGFELLMAPYAIGHLQISLLLQELGIPLPEGERFQLYLTNALDMESLQQATLPGLASLSEESYHAAKVKKQEPILVILGNPPYSGHSANKGLWEKELKEDYDGLPSYYKVDNRPLGEKNPKWLQDDYVKFLRFAQWKIHKAGRGIVAMITNHSYLDNPTFRGMRQSLLQTFDEIYILDLHGNSLKRETAPSGGPDENVFDIRQGVAIGFFVKHGNPEKRGVYHADLYGRREDKYTWLTQHTLHNTPFQPIQPTSPFYFLVPRQMPNSESYFAWPSVPEIFPLSSVGIVTARDHLTIHETPEKVWNVVQAFVRLDPETAREAFQLGKDARDWKVALAQQDLRADGGPHKDKITPILYRPFDVRYTYYTGRSRGFHCMPRPEVMRHMLAGENLALITTRQVKASETWQHCFVSNRILESCLVSNHTSEIGYAFPLYLYPSAESSGVFEEERRPNLAEWLLPRLSTAYGFTPTPQEVLAYIYAVLYSPTYRRVYAEALRSDFPRIPFVAEGEVFRRMAELGRRLIDLHLLRSKDLDPPRVRFEGEGDGQIQVVRYEPSSQRVYINRSQYFEPVPLQVWTYQIGGYQVLEKYLKDRKGRRLEDPVHYLRVATAISLTLEVQADIEAVYAAVAKGPWVEGLSQAVV
jgi:type I restriction-modification system DNA methylase subunit